MNSDPLRNLTWKLNWFRQSELEGSLLLGRMVGTVDDPHLIQRLTRHCAEEAEHSRLWADAIARLDLPTVRIYRSYQSFYLRYSGPPATLLDVLCFTQVFERRVHRRFQEEMVRPDLPEAARHAFAKMIEDERDHLGWVAAWLKHHSQAADGLRRYAAIDRQVFAELEPFEQCLWRIPGLGRERNDSSAVTMQRP